MDYEKIGLFIKNLRKEKGLTQRELGEILCVSDRAVSKWERCVGCPDITQLIGLSEVFGVNIDQILLGEVNSNDFLGGNMKKSKYYVCPICNNLIISTGSPEISCCGKRLNELEAKKPDENNSINISQVEQDYYITSNHTMVKEHYISFVAFTTGDSIEIIKKYPEWDFEVRIPKRRHGRLFWYCIRDGLFYKDI